VTMSMGEGPTRTYFDESGGDGVLNTPSNRQRLGVGLPHEGVARTSSVEKAKVAVLSEATVGFNRTAVPASVAIFTDKSITLRLGTDGRRVNVSSTKV